MLGAQRAEDRREQERLSGRCRPPPTAPAAAGGLLGRGYDGAARHPAGGELTRALVGRVGDPVVPARRAEAVHGCQSASRSVTSAPGMTPSSAEASPRLIASARLPFESS